MKTKEELIQYARSHWTDTIPSWDDIAAASEDSMALLAAAAILRFATDEQLSLNEVQVRVRDGWRFTSDSYNREFLCAARELKSLPFEHVVLHAVAAVGALARACDRASHRVNDPGVIESVDKYIADLVACAAQLTNRFATKKLAEIVDVRLHEKMKP